MKRVGMLVVSLRGVNFGFWFHLECSGQNAFIFLNMKAQENKYEGIFLNETVKVSYRVVRDKI